MSHNQPMPRNTTDGPLDRNGLGPAPPHIPPHVPPQPSRQQRRHTNRQLSKWLDKHDPWEWPEKAWELEDEDPWAEIQLHKLIVERGPEHWRHYLHLADACRRLGQPEPALEAARLAHEADSECPESLQLLLECLVDLGRDWRTFPWQERPDVLTLDARTRQLCLDLVGEKELMDSDELWFELTLCRPHLFDADQLARFLASDSSFELERFEGRVFVVRS